MKTALFFWLALVGLVSAQGLRPAFLSSTTPVAAGGGSAATAADTFNRADVNPLDSPMSDGVGTWTSGPGGSDPTRILSNVGQGTADWSGARINSPTFSADQKMTVQLVSGSLSGVGVCVRLASASDCDGYMVYCDTTTSVTVYKITDGGTLSFAGIGAAFTQTLTAGHTLGISAEGTSTVTLRVFYDDVQIGTRTDSTSPYTTGQPGILLNGATIACDSISATDL